MDYHSLKRKELQALCKKHNIPANSANSVLADKLSALLNEKQKPITKQRTCMKSTVETAKEGEPASSKRQKKKVRFSPNNDLVEYALRSGEKQKDMVTQIKARRKSVAKKGEKPVVDNNTTVELVEDSNQAPVKLTRSRLQSPGKDVVLHNEKIQSKREAKDVKKETDADKENVGNFRKVTRSKAHPSIIGGDVQQEENRQSERLNKDAEKASESVGESVVSRARVTRSKTQTKMEVGTGPDVNPLMKKKSGKQAETDGQNVEPFKETMDVPVRATRSGRQTLMEGIGNLVTDPPAGKKRSRKEMKATDLGSNLRHVALVDKKEPPKRKSSRTRGVGTVDEDEGDKVEVFKVGRVTRSKAPLEMEASGRNSGNKANKVEVQQLEEPSKHVSKKNVNRRKSVLQPEKSEAVLHPVRKNTRRKSVMQKATPMVESPSVGKKQSKGRYSNLSVIESSEDKENVIRSGKVASEIEFKEATTGSPKSRKRRGTPIIEDQIIENECKSPKPSACSSQRSEEKFVAKRQVDSSLKKSVSRMNNQSSVENSSKGKSLAIRSGAIIRDSSFKKRAKLSGTEQSDSEVHDVNFSKEVTPVANMRNYRESSSKKTAKASGSKLLQSDSEDVGANSSKDGTPVANMENFKIDEELTEAEVTPAIGKSERRFTRSAIRSEIKEPSQSAIKEQPFADTRLTSPKVAKFRPDPTVNTAPGRITRRGIKHGGNAAGSFSEKVGKMKQTSQSVRKRQSLDDAQMASPEVPEVGPKLDVGTEGVLSAIKQSFDEVRMSPLEVAEVVPITDVKISSPEVAEVLANPDSDTAIAGSETSKEVLGQMVVGESASESVRSRNKVVETSIDIECASPVSEEDISGEVMEDAGASIEKSTYEASATPLGEFSRIRMTPDLMTDVVKTIPDEVLDGSHVQNQNEEAYVESGIFNEAVNLETSVTEPVRPESPDPKEKETELTESGSISNCLQTDVMIEEPLVSVGKAVVMEENVISSLGIFAKGNIAVDDNNCDSISYDVGSSAVRYASIQQLDVADDGEQNDKDESAGAQMPLMSEPVYEDRDVADGVGVVGDYDDESNRDDTLDQLTVDNKLQENDTEVDTVAAHDSLAEYREPSTGVNVIYGYAINGSDVTDDTGKQVAKEHEFEVGPSTSNNINDIPIFAKSEGEDGSVYAAKERETDSMPLPACNMTQYPLLSGGDGEDDGVTTNNKHESNPDSFPDIDAYDASLLGEDELSISRQPEPSLEPSSADDIIEIHFTCNDSYGDCDNAVSDQKSLADDGEAQDGGSDHDQLPSNDNPEEDVGGDMLVGCDQEPEQMLVVSVDDDVCDQKSLADDGEAQDGGSDHDQLPINDNPEEDVGGDMLVGCDQEPEQMLVVSVDDDVCDMVGQSGSATSKDTPTTVATSGNDELVVRVDALEESALDINKDLVSSILGDTCDMDAEDDRSSEQRLIESDEGSLPEECEGVSWITKDSFPITYNKAESPVDDTDSDFLTVKEDDTNKQEETRNAGTSVDWGDFDIGMDEFEKPISAEGGADVVGKGKTDDQYLDLQTSARTSSSIEEGFGLASRLSNSASNLEKGSRNVADGKSNQEADMLKESAKAAVMTQEGFNWSDSSLKSLFTTPATTRISHEKSSQDDAVDFACQEHYSSLKPSFKTPAGPQISHVKVGQEDAVSFANQDPYTSLKTLFATPSTTQIGHVKDDQEDAGSTANQDPYSSLKSLIKTPASSRTSHVKDHKSDAVNVMFPAGRSNEDVGASGSAAHAFNHQWENDHSKVFDGETKCNVVRGSENEMYGVPRFDHDPLKLFGDEEVGGSIDRSRRNTHFEFNGDQVDQIKQFEFLSGAVGTSHQDPSGFKDKSTHSGKFENEKETLMKGSETDDHLQDMNDYRG